MTSRTKLSRNDACPCGSGDKYKRCCKGKVAWEDLLAQPLSDQLPHITARGRNIMFIEHLAEALQLDDLPSRKDFASVKRAFTQQAVLEIHEALVALWPSESDCIRCLQKESSRVTALYSGNYQPQSVYRALQTHALYSDKILLTDPFMHPHNIADTYNPLLHPDKHRTVTAKWCFLWFSLAQWIQADLVSFIRTPADFNSREFHEILDIETQKFKSHPELSQQLASDVDQRVRQMGPVDGDFGEYLILANSDESYREMYRKNPSDAKGLTEEEFLTWIHQRRANHPYYLKPLKGKYSEFFCETYGANYEAGKRICNITNSHIITDLPTRWKEVEFDHQHATGNTAAWSPFAKALQSAGLKVLQETPLEAASVSEKRIVWSS